MKSKVTFGILKPDCILRGLERNLFNDISMHGFRIEITKKKILTKEDVYFLYGHNKNKSFFPELLKYMTSGPSICFIASLSDGRDAIKEMNKLVGHYNPSLADDGTLRRKYAISNFLPYKCIQNIIHSSKSLEEAQREIAYFFPTYVTLLNSTDFYDPFREKVRKN
jgi:nucleoside-diphosphate kinase